MNTAPSVASGVLCIIVPCISSLKLQVKQSTNKHTDDSLKVRLAQHPQFWKFIKKALHSEATISVDSRGMKGGGTFLARSNDNPYSNETGMEDDNVGQLVRRRSIHILRLLIEKEYDDLARNFTKSKESSQQFQSLKSKLTIWKKYVICFEALEMEEEAHLVDQVWDTVIELCAACKGSNTDEEGQSDCQNSPMTLPSISWDMVGSLLARLLLSDLPTLRKIALFRILTGRAGISLTESSQIQDQEKEKPNKKDKKKNKNKKSKKTIGSSPISIITPQFILKILVPSFDSIPSTGFNFVDPEDGKTSNHDLSLLVKPFITAYCKSLETQPTRIEEFMRMIFCCDFITSVKMKSIVMVFEAVADVWSTDECINKFRLANESISDIVQSLYKLFYTGSVVIDYRISLLQHLSTILSKAEPFDPKNKPQPLLILDVLILYVTTEEITKDSEKNENEDKWLHQWLLNIYDEKFLVTVASSVAASFVSGQLLPFESKDDTIDDTLVLTTVREREIGASIAKLCSLVGRLGLSSASSMLWPAINKGLGCIHSNTHISNTAAQQAARGLILLESGCKECILSGIGHGDLIVDKQGNMVPPPPSIEDLLSSAINFLIHQLKRVSVCDVNMEQNEKVSHVAKIGTGSYFPNHFALIINQIVALKRAFPSSVIMSSAIFELLVQSLDDCTNENVCKIEQNDIIANISLVKNMCILLGTLSFASEEMLQEVAKDKNFVQCCLVLLQVKFETPSTSQLGIQGWQIKAMRSIFQHAKWGSLALLLPQTFATSSNSTTSLVHLHNRVIDTAIDSVNATPEKGILALFGCVIIAAKNCFKLFIEVEKKDRVKSYIKNMSKIIDALFTVMDDTAQNVTRAYMLQCTCSLIFRPERLVDEYTIFELCQKEGMNISEIDLPIRSAFRKMITMAGTNRPYISKYVISYISSAWIGRDTEIGLSAIPYREDIAKLLIHKEAKMDVATSHKEGLVQDDDIQREGGFTLLPKNTPDTSVARGFLLTFISSLPNPESGLHEDVKRKVCYYLILWLLDAVCLQEQTGAMVTGASVYCQILRAWQTLCLLSRFVTSDIAEMVCVRVFKAMVSIINKVM